jgi:hypothetical protein
MPELKVQEYVFEFCYVSCYRRFDGGFSVAVKQVCGSQ